MGHPAPNPHNVLTLFGPHSGHSWLREWNGMALYIWQRPLHHGLFWIMLFWSTSKRTSSLSCLNMLRPKKDPSGSRAIVSLKQVMQDKTREFLDLGQVGRTTPNVRACQCPGSMEDKEVLGEIGTSTNFVSRPTRGGENVFCRGGVEDFSREFSQFPRI